jgi:hypothetical protein
MTKIQNWSTFSAQLPMKRGETSFINLQLIPNLSNIEAKSAKNKLKLKHAIMKNMKIVEPV